VDPFIYARHKHHLPAMVELLDAVRRAGANDEALIAPILAMGDGVCDVYIGALSVDQVQGAILAHLEAHGVAGRDAFAAHLIEHGQLQRLGHYLERAMDDGSRFVVRAGTDPARYIHLHPSRHAPLTRRARMPMLKSALMTCALAAGESGSPRELTRLNRARARLVLPPLRELPTALGELIDLVWSRHTS